MDKKIVITDMEIQGQSVRVSGLLCGRRLIEARCERTDGDGILGNIYIGRVQKVVKNIRSAFIQISPELPACYYSLERGGSPVFVKKMPSADLVQGDELLVQVQKEGVKSKAPTVTSNLSLNGRYAVLTTQDKRIGVSSKVDKEERERLRAFAGEHYHGEFGLIIRTNASSAGDGELLAEIGYLSETMEDLIEKAKTRSCFSCMYRADAKYMSYLRNCYQDGLAEIVTDLPSVYAETEAFRERYPAMRSVGLRLYEDPQYPLSALYNLEGQLKAALQKKVWMKSGGYLVIEPTEALTVIDVNTGKSTAKKDIRTHFLNINLEAAAEIAFQLRLRNISGIIIVDFIDMPHPDDRREVLNALREAVGKDPIPVQVLDMTRLDLVEMTRKKIEKSLMEQLT